jgi:hypothetical protein
MEHRQTQTDTSMQVGLEINTEKNMYVLMSLDQNAGQNHNTKQISDIWEQQQQIKI